MAGIKVDGLSMDDIMRMDANEINSLSRKDLASITSRLASVANKRMKRMRKAGLESPALSTFESRKQGVRFSVKGKNINQLRHTFKSAKGFLNLKTSSIKGAREWHQNVSERIGEMTPNQEKRFWRIFDKFRKTSAYQGMSAVATSDEIVEMISDWYTASSKNKRMRIADTLDQWERMADELYESRTSKNPISVDDALGIFGDID